MSLVGEIDNKRETAIKRLLTFFLGDQEYAIELERVREAIAMPTAVTALPHAHPHVVGIIDLRGEVVPLIDMRIKIQMEGRMTDDTAVIICKLRNAACGIVVDAVSSVVSLGASDIKESPGLQGTIGREFIIGVTERGGKFMLILDIDQFLDPDDHVALKQASGA